MMTTDELWARIDNPPEGCWTWAEARTSDGRGSVVWNGRQQYVYRVLYELEVGPIPAGLVACHTCDNPACVRPAHIFIGTQRDNMRDASRKGRMPGGGARGQAHPKSTCTDGQVAEARRMYATGLWTQRAIAAELSVHKSTVGDWVRGKVRAPKRDDLDGLVSGLPEWEVAS